MAFVLAPAVGAGVAVGVAGRLDIDALRIELQLRRREKGDVGEKVAEGDRSAVERAQRAE